MSFLLAHVDNPNACPAVSLFSVSKYMLGTGHQTHDFSTGKAFLVVFVTGQ